MTKVTFRCKKSGNTVSFSDEYDIAGMRENEDYTEVVEPRSETPSSFQKPTSEPPKRGRPKKAA